MNWKYFLSLYKPNYVLSLVYMLQASEYSVRDYLQWYWRTKNFDEVMNRGKLDFTPKATLLTVGAILVTSFQLVVAAYLVSRGFDAERWDMGAAGLGLLLLTPVLTAYALIIPLQLGTLLIQKPKSGSMTSQAQRIFAEHPGVSIVVAGSYGKTSTKETLKTVLGEQLKVAATPANLNTPLALADFAESLEGDEDVLVIELGEFKPGDIIEFADLVDPDAAVITGLAEAHLDTLGSLDAAAENLLSLKEYVAPEALFINADSEKLAQYVADIPHEPYGKKGVMGWKISKIKTSLEGTSFEIKKGKTKISAKSELLGEHTVGMLALAIAMAKEFKLRKQKIEKGVGKTKPFDHRLQLSRNDDVVVIDDTYNGNIEGVAAGVAFVAGLEAKRKVYVTPGLVEMGDQAEAVNTELGKIVAPVFDAVALMKNAQSDYIVDGLHAAGFSGETTIVEDPVEFYQNLDSFTSDGDVVLMQNDLPDNYN